MGNQSSSILFLEEFNNTLDQITTLTETKELHEMLKIPESGENVFNLLPLKNIRNLMENDIGRVKILLKLLIGILQEFVIQDNVGNIVVSNTIRILTRIIVVVFEMETVEREILWSAEEVVVY